MKTNLEKFSDYVEKKYGDLIFSNDIHEMNFMHVTVARRVFKKNKMGTPRKGGASFYVSRDDFIIYIKENYMEKII